METREYTVTVQELARWRAAQLRAKRRAKAERLRKRTCGAIAFISFFMLLGSVGALENDSITLAQGAVQMLLSGGALGLFSWLAGGFDYEEAD